MATIDNQQATIDLVQTNTEKKNAGNTLSATFIFNEALNALSRLLSEMFQTDTGALLNAIIIFILSLVKGLFVNIVISNPIVSAVIDKVLDIPAVQAIIQNETVKATVNIITTQVQFIASKVLDNPIINTSGKIITVPIVFIVSNSVNIIKTIISMTK